MNKSSVKVTYSLDLLTVREVEVMAREWGLPKSEIIRRAVHAATARMDTPRPTPSKAEALKVLQAEPRPSPDELAARMQEVRDERRAR